MMMFCFEETDPFRLLLDDLGVVFPLNGFGDRTTFRSRLLQHVITTRASRAPTGNVMVVNDCQRDMSFYAAREPLHLE